MGDPVNVSDGYAGSFAIRERSDYYSGDATAFVGIMKDASSPELVLPLWEACGRLTSDENITNIIYKMSGWTNSDESRFYTAIDYAAYELMVSEDYDFNLYPYGTELIDNPVVYINTKGYILPEAGTLQTVYAADSIIDTLYYSDINLEETSVSSIINGLMGDTGPFDLSGTHYLKVTTYNGAACIATNEDGSIRLIPNSAVYTQQDDFAFEAGKMYVIEYFDAKDLLSVSSYNGDEESGIKITVKPLVSGSSDAIINDLTFIARGEYIPSGYHDRTMINLGTITYKDSGIEFYALNDAFTYSIKDPAVNPLYTDYEVIILNGTDNGPIGNVGFKHIWIE